MTDIKTGIVIGGAGRTIAGLTNSLVQYVYLRVVEVVHKKRVYAWLKSNTLDSDGKR